MKISIVTILIGLCSISMPFSNEGRAEPGETGMMLASSSGSKSKARDKRQRERHINRELSYSNKDKNNIDFESVEIGGESKSPLDGLVQSARSGKDGNFVKIRTRWHPEMMSSASSLGFAGTGRGR